MPQFPFRHVCWKASRLLQVRFHLFSFSFLSLTGHFRLFLFLSPSQLPRAFPPLWRSRAHFPPGHLEGSLSQRKSPMSGSDISVLCQHNAGEACPSLRLLCLSHCSVGSPRIVAIAQWETAEWWVTPVGEKTTHLAFPETWSPCLCLSASGSSLLFCCLLFFFFQILYKKHFLFHSHFAH